jgi:VWFA-related protein
MPPDPISGQDDGNPVFRAGTQEVLVDAAVTDKKGAFQGDLTQQDFQLFEDGKPQKITSFSLVGAGRPGHGAPHFIALVFENEQPGLRDGVARFVDRFASPDLYFAVYSHVETEMRLQQAFTTDTARVQAALRSMEISRTGPLKEMAATKSRRFPFFDRVDNVAAALGPIRGRKALILFSSGQFLNVTGIGVNPGPPPPMIDVRPTIARCDAANVSVYSFRVSERLVDAPGVIYDPPKGPDGNYHASTDFLRDLAAGTGGKYTPPGTYDLASYLGTVTKEHSEYYVLGYTPLGDAADKPCHKIKVKVDRSGLDVTARDTYCTSGESSAHALRPAERALESKSAPAIAPAMQLSWFYSKPGTAIVDLAMDLDLRGKQFNLLGVAYREDGSVAERTGDTVKPDSDPPFHYTKQFSFPPGRYRFRMTVGAGGEALGSVEKPLDIAPWSGETLSASGIALSVEGRRLAGAASELDSSLLEGPHRLISRGNRIVPMAGARFDAGHDGVFYFEIYNPHGATPPPRIRILDRTSGEQKSDSGPIDIRDFVRPDNPVTPIALALPVSKLSAGSYTLEVRVGDNVLRTADFHVK